MRTEALADTLNNTARPVRLGDMRRDVAALIALAVVGVMLRRGAARRAVWPKPHSQRHKYHSDGAPSFTA